jgi:hypothetical protein
MGQEQFSLPLEPQMDESEIADLSDALQRNHELAGVTSEVSKMGSETLEITLSGSGVTSTFTVDIYTLAIILNKEKSRDLFDSPVNSFDRDARPLRDADEIHDERKAIIKQTIRDILDPQLIED